MPELDVRCYRNPTRESFFYEVGFGGNCGSPKFAGISLENRENREDNKWEILIFKSNQANRSDTLKRQPSEELLIMLQHAKDVPNYAIIDKLLEEYPETEICFR